MPALCDELEASVTVPDLSVVIASVNGWNVLAPTLAALESLREHDRIEILVVETVGGETRERLREEYPSVVVVESPRRAIPKLRYQGVLRSTGRLVAILEDHAEVQPDWAASIFRAHEGPWAAVGGAVENGLDGLTNWAVFFCEYTAYMPPVPEGVYGDIPGNNIAYKRSYLLKHARELDQGKWESWINDRLRVDGASIASTNAMVVRHIKPFRLGYFVNQRFHFARSYAGMRRVDQSWPKRLAYGAGSSILPVLLTARLTRAVLSKRRDLGRFFLVFPLVVLFLTVGAVGEMVGYLLGAGDSLEKVE
jgi:glycosyl transferase family 2